MLAGMYSVLNLIHVAASWRSAQQFEAALGDPEPVQKRILLELLKRNQACAYGKQFGFSSIRSIREYQDRVPIVSYDDLAPWMERMKAGRQGILTDEPVVMFENSSGSVSAAKYIPYTRTLRAQFQSALAPWIADLYRSFPKIARGIAYWVVTPLARQREATRGGIPVGFENDAEYFGTMQRWVLQKIMAVPAEFARVNNLHDSLYLTLRFLLQARDLSFVSVWSPSFLKILLGRLELHGDSLVTDLLDGSAGVGATLPPRITARLRRDATQARNLRAMLSRGTIEPTVLWPKLALISCWTSAESAALKNEIQLAFPRIPIQGKGLLATEGVVSIPIEKYQGCVTAIRSHFLEFQDVHTGACYSVSEVNQGGEYSVLLTTGGGLWRYRLGDGVRVTGFARETPLLEFVGKEDCVCDLRGEKLNATFVANALAELECCRNARFAMVAPSNAETPYYSLFLERRRCEPDLPARLEAKLRANPHYAYCRDLGQLGELQVFLIESGAHEAYLKACESFGQRAGTVKPTALHKRNGWEKIFTGQYVTRSHVEVCA